MTQSGWYNALANMAHFDGVETFPAFWADRAEAYRTGAAAIEEDIP